VGAWFQRPVSLNYLQQQLIPHSSKLQCSSLSVTFNLVYYLQARL
jgi:hypothetical protein